MLPKKCSALETSIRLGYLYPKEGIKRVKTEDKYRYYSLTSLLHDPWANPIPSVSFATQATSLRTGGEAASNEEGEMFLLLAV